MTPNHGAAPAGAGSVFLPSWQAIRAALAPLWAPGLALLCLGLAALATRYIPLLGGRVGLWTPYLVLGTLFPLLAAVGVAAAHRGWRPPRLLFGALITLPILASSLLAGPIGAVVACGLAGGQTVLCLAIISRYGQVTLARAAGMFVAGFVAWAVMLQMFTWEALATALPPSWPMLIIGALSVLACCWWAYGESEPRAGGSRLPPRTLDLVALLVLPLLAFRTDGLFTTDRLGADGTFYHWGVLVGPAEAVRQGGWLLWDTPSPYGFLTTLTLAAFPAATAWQSLYVLNALASLALALWLYRVVRANRPGLGGFAFALVVSGAVVFLVSTYPPTLSPEHYFPMSGAFRYGWCFVLIAVLLLERAATPGSRRHTLTLVLGCVCWLLAMLWSAEIAVYSSVIWLPAFMLITLRDHAGLAGRRRWLAIVGWLAVPPVLLAVAIAGIVLIYQQALGHGPDGAIYVGSVLSFTSSRAGDVSGLFTATAAPVTIVAALLGCLLLAVVAVSIARTRAGWRDVPVVLALAFGVWALASYPVGLPLPFTVYRLMPFLVLALALVQADIIPVFQGQPVRPWIDTVRVGSVALLAGLLTTVFANGDELRFYAAAISTEGYHARDVTIGLPHSEPALERLMQQAGVAATDPIYYAGGEWGDMMPVWNPAPDAEPVIVSQQWLAGPISTMALRQDARKQTFLRRAADRQHQGGWLIQRRQQTDLIYTVGPWFFTEVQNAFVPARIAANEAWQLVWYEPLDEWSARYGARVPPATAPMLPRDLAISGVSPNETVFPAAWGYFGPEWLKSTAGRGWRCAPGRGSVGIFTATAQSAELSFRFDVGEGGLSVSLNDGPASPVTVRRNRAEVRLALEPGWNTMVIERTAANDTEPAATPTSRCEDEGGVPLPLQIDSTVLRFTRDAAGP